MWVAWPSLAAAALAIVVVGLAANRLGVAMPPLRPLSPILTGAILVFGVGLVDDLRPLSAWPKVVVQLLAATIVMASGLLIERVTLGAQTWQLGVMSWPVTLGWIVGLTNAFNLIDGLDGLAAGIGVIAGATCAAILIGRGHVAEAMVLIGARRGGPGFSGL